MQIPSRDGSPSAPLDTARFTACIEMLFVNETDRFEDRIRLAKASGLGAVEFWHWAYKDIEAISRASTAAGIGVHALAADFKIGLLDLSNIEQNMASLRRSIAVTRQLGAPLLIAQAGYINADRSRAKQREALVASLRILGSVLGGSGVTLALEPLNTRVDHKGYFLDSTAEGLDIIDAVGSSHVRLLFDIYHSMVMAEDIAGVVGDRVDRIAHVHVADAPGRNERGEGSAELARSVAWLCESGYTGMIGLEFRPTTDSVEAISFLLQRLSDQT